VPLGLRKNTKIDLISKVPLFAGLSKSDLGHVALITDEIDFAKDKVLIREGEPGREFFVLLDGEVDVRRKGRRLATKGKGDFFGEIALVSNVPRTATVTTTSSARALVIRDLEFKALLEQKPQIALKVLAAVAERLPEGS
jgi:CRP/FNR family transcriptional regulator, cyclic AMP receptor protein